MKKYAKPLIIITCLIIFQSVLYLLSKTFQSNPNLLRSGIDDMIPHSIYAIYPYAIWYALLYIIPISLYFMDNKLFKKYALSFIIMIIICNIIYVIYPTTVSRPDIIVNGFTSTLADFVLKWDYPILNCFPSIHSTVSILFIIVALKNKKYNNYIKIAIISISIIIIASTLFIKQHVVQDIISAIPVMIGSWLIATYILKKKQAI